MNSYHPNATQRIYQLPVQKLTQPPRPIPQEMARREAKPKTDSSEMEIRRLKRTIELLRRENTALNGLLVRAEVRNAYYAEHYVPRPVRALSAPSRAVELR